MTEQKRIISAGLIGNILEWYDFAIYGFFAAIIGMHFFPSDNPTTSLIASFGAFAAGFLMRPIGAILFGRIGDLVGRKQMLVLSIMLMAIPTFIIGLLPTHEQIGVTAAILMVLMRMLQGLSVGGEYTGSIIYLTEHAPKQRRGLFGSFSPVGATIGILLGSAVGALLNSNLSESAMHEWGWRIPFLSGMVIAVVGWVVRRQLPDTPVDKNRSESPLKETFSKHTRPMWQIIGLSTMGAVVFYMLFIYLPSWMVTEAGQSRAVSLEINTFSLLVLLLGTLFFAWLSDRIGRRPLLLLSTLFLVLFSYPLVKLMNHHDYHLIVIGQGLFALIFSMFVGVMPATLVELFPWQVRATAVSVGYNLPYAIFGGTAPLVATWLVATSHNPLAIAYYLIIVAIIAFIVSLGLKETKDSTLI